MRGRAELIRINNIGGGEASIFPYTAMPSKFSTLLQNLVISENGTIKKVPGYAKVNAAAATGINFTSGFEYRKKAGTQYLLAAGGGYVKQITGTTLTDVATGLDNGSQVNFSMMNDLAVMTNGVDAPQKWNGTTLASLGGTPPATAFKTHIHKGRLWGLERANKMIASHTILNNPEDWTGTGSGYLDFNYVLKQGDNLLDMFTFVDLHVFCFRNHLAIYSGSTPAGTTADYAISQLIEGAGIINTNAQLGFGTDHVVLHDGGLKGLKQIVTTGALTVGELTQAIAPTIRAAIGGNSGQAYCLAHVPAKSWIMMLIGSVIYIYNYAFKAWSRIVPGHTINYIFTTLAGDIYLCGNEYVYKMDDTLGTFDGANIATVWETAWLPLSRAGEYVFPKILEFSVKSTTKPITFTVSQFTEANISQQYSVTGTLISGVTDFDNLSPLDEDVHEHIRVPVYGRGRQMMMRISNTSSIVGFEICDFSLQFTRGGF